MLSRIADVLHSCDELDAFIEEPHVVMIDKGAAVNGVIEGKSVYITLQFG